MFFSLKADCFFRHYDDIGHICLSTSNKEEVVDQNGAIFIEQLTYEPQEIDKIVSALLNHFEGVSFAQLKQDVIAFYLSLCDCGFLYCSEKFPNENTQVADSMNFDAEASSSFLVEYFGQHPCLETFHVELTSRCNERCVHCYIPHEDKLLDMAPDTMLQALNQCKELNVMTIIFSGGEPMLHPQFCELLCRAKDLDFNTVVLSNLTMLNDSTIDALQYKHPTRVKVSLYSMQADIHDAITTVPGSWEKSVQNILRLLESSIPVQINCPVIKQNINSFDEVVQWGKQHHCAVACDYLIMARDNFTTDNLDNRLSAEDLKSVIGKIVVGNFLTKRDEMAMEPKRSTMVPSSYDKRVCGVGISMLCMESNGDIYPCVGWHKYRCGNIKDSSLLKIWSESPQLNYLRGIRLKDFKKCANCQDKDYCLMCISRNSNESCDGNIFDIPQITCDAAHTYRKIIEKYKQENGLSLGE